MSIIKNEKTSKVVINVGLNKNIYINAEDLIIGYADGKPVKIKDLFQKIQSQDEEIKTLNMAHNELVTKYNALLASYKYNTAKTAMQFVDLEENN